MSYATYCLRPNFQLAEDYLADVSRLADEVLASARELHPLLESLGESKGYWGGGESFLRLTCGPARGRRGA